jgi:Family of unknown function (DUF6361)
LANNDAQRVSTQNSNLNYAKLNHQMSSTFTWLDYSDYERRKVLDVVELFRESSTVDEIGIGPVRDVFSDLWFPGTSTIQTTAKYFLLIPWTYLTLEKKRTQASDIAAAARKLETKTIEYLLQSGATQGVIGRVARERLLRLPSEAYWQGLGAWGIRRFNGSRDAYHRSIDSFYDGHFSRGLRMADFDGDGPEEYDTNWDSELPAVPSGFPAGISMDLSEPEANYLKHRVLISRPHSLLAHMLRQSTPVTGEALVWELPLELNQELAHQIHHARLFSEVILGAQLLYNILLSEMAEKRGLQNRLDDFLTRWTKWSELVQDRRRELSTWSLAEFWKLVISGNPHIGRPTKAFIDGWIELVKTSSTPALRNHKGARELVANREKTIKKGLARVLGGRPLELWSGESGSAQLDFRWWAARRIYLDIARAG